MKTVAQNKDFLNSVYKSQTTSLLNRASDKELKALSWAIYLVCHNKIKLDSKDSKKLQLLNKRFRYFKKSFQTPKSLTRANILKRVGKKRHLPVLKKILQFYFPKTKSIKNVSINKKSNEIVSIDN